MTFRRPVQFSEVEPHVPGSSARRRCQRRQRSSPRLSLFVGLVLANNRDSSRLQHPLEQLEPVGVGRPLGHVGFRAADSSRWNYCDREASVPGPVLNTTDGRVERFGTRLFPTQMPAPRRASGGSGGCLDVVTLSSGSTVRSRYVSTEPPSLEPRTTEPAMARRMRARLTPDRYAGRICHPESS